MIYAFQALQVSHLVVCVDWMSHVWLSLRLQPPSPLRSDRFRLSIRFHLSDRSPNNALDL